MGCESCVHTSLVLYGIKPYNRIDGGPGRAGTCVAGLTTVTWLTLAEPGPALVP